MTHRPKHAGQTCFGKEAVWFVVGLRFSGGIGGAG